MDRKANEIFTRWYRVPFFFGKLYPESTNTEEEGSILHIFWSCSRLINSGLRLEELSNSWRMLIWGVTQPGIFYTTLTYIGNYIKILWWSTWWMQPGHAYCFSGNRILPHRSPCGLLKLMRFSPWKISWPHFHVKRKNSIVSGSIGPNLFARANMPQMLKWETEIPPFFSFFLFFHFWSLLYDAMLYLSYIFEFIFCYKSQMICMRSVFCHLILGLDELPFNKQDG